MPVFNGLLKVYCSHVVCLILFSTLANFSCAGALVNEDASTLGNDVKQIEVYYQNLQNHGSTPMAPEDQITPGASLYGVGVAKGVPVMLSYGLSNNLDLNIGSTYYYSPRSNFSPVTRNQLSFKWRFYEEDAEDGLGWNAAIKPLYILPSSVNQQSNGFGLSASNYGLSGITSYAFESLVVGVNATYLRAPYNINYPVGGSFDPLRTNYFMINVAPVWEFVPGVKLAFEVGASTNPPSQEQYLSGYTLAALIYSPVKDLDLGFSYMRSAVNFSNAYSAIGLYSSQLKVGFTFRFK